MTSSKSSITLRVQAYAVTSDTRLALAPDTPTFAEMGLPALSFSGWYGLFAPKGTPKDIIGKLNAAAVKALADPAVRSRFVDLGLEVFPRAAPLYRGPVVQLVAHAGQPPVSAGTANILSYLVTRR
jgi:tripartite-type tricarboxylate transporter receptor subunit TctC